jgi:cytochrome c oxidase subunit 2
LWAAVSCTEETPAVFRPRGSAARQINQLWWILFGLGGVTYLIVMGLMVFALFRRRQASASQNNKQMGNRIIWIGGVIFPLIILLIVYGFTFSVLSQLSISDDPDQLVVEVIGHQWWWEVRYPEYDVITANEIYIPTGEEVTFRLTSDDVIHSFWVPELHGKMDLIPGRTNTWQLTADQSGDYWGLCAEFCGIQHAKMLFLVTAVPPEQFGEWLERRQEPAAVPATAEAQAGFEIFMESGCAECHAIRGTEAAGDLGPDLTHLAARRTLAAGAIANNRGNLAGWVADPHGIKPGSMMPTAELTGSELQSLLTYLETLE